MNVLSLVGRGHLSDERLVEIASSANAGPAETERTHLARCAWCRRLLNGHRRASAALTGPWLDRPIAAQPEGSVVRQRLDIVTPVSTPRARRAFALQLGGIAALLVVATAASFVWLSRSPMSSPAVTFEPVTFEPVQETRVVATLPGDSFEWSPDGRYLLVQIGADSAVYDRSGRLVSKSGSVGGWIDATHLMTNDGRVVDATTPGENPYVANVRSVPNGHGSAALIVATPACVGDPSVKWYRNGQLGAQEKLSPFGWSFDGRLALEGHLSCSTNDAETHGWKGQVDVVEFATGKVLASVPDVRGALLFSPDGRMLAAQSDRDTKLVDIESRTVSVATGRFLGWRDETGAYVESGGQVGLIEPGATTVPTTISIPIVHGTPEPIVEGQIGAPNGQSSFGINRDGTVTRLVGRAGDTLLDVSTLHLTAPTASAVPQGDQWSLSTGMLQRTWSPDGSMLALPGQGSITLISIGRTTAEASPAPSPQHTASGPVATTAKESSTTTLPGNVFDMVYDSSRDSLWFAYLSGSGPADLYRYSIPDGKLSKWSLPEFNDNGLVDRIALASDGSVWFADLYTIVRFDPDTAKMTTITLPSVDPDAVPNANGGIAPWVSQIAFDGSGRAIVARQSTTSLLLLDAGFHEVGRVPLPKGMTSLRDLAFANGRIYAVRTEDAAVWVIDSSGGVATKTQALASRLAVANGRVWVGGWPSWIEPDGSIHRIDGVYGDRLAATPDGVAVFAGGTSVWWVDRSGKVGEWVDFGSKPAITSAPDGGPAKVLLANGSAQCLAIDKGGRVWAIIHDGWRLSRLEPGEPRGPDHSMEPVFIP